MVSPLVLWLISQLDFALSPSDMCKGFDWACLYDLLSILSRCLQKRSGELQISSRSGALTYAPKWAEFLCTQLFPK